MQKDFHYYATYCAAFLAGYNHEESLDICYSAQFVDLCTKTFLDMVKGPNAAATTQLQLELMDAGGDPLSLQEMTRIWASFHFLPGDLHADRKKCSKRYRNKYRLICHPNSELLVETVKSVKGSSLQAAGIAMHVLADTWAHRNFAGTPSLVINNTDFHFDELVPDDPRGDGRHGEETPGTGRYRRRRITFRHSVSAEDDIVNGVYINSPFQTNENSIMNLGHGRAGHLPDYSFARYAYLPAWKDYEEIIKDNPSDYLHAFCQMIYALKYLHGDVEDFSAGIYDSKAVIPWNDEIYNIITKRQLDACDDWKALGEKISGREIPDFDIGKYQQEYIEAAPDMKDDTYLGKFFMAALKHKSMVTSRIFASGNPLAGISIDFDKKGFKGIRDYRKLVEQHTREALK